MYELQYDYPSIGIVSSDLHEILGKIGAEFGSIHTSHVDQWSSELVRIPLIR